MLGRVTIVLALVAMIGYGGCRAYHEIYQAGQGACQAAHRKAAATAKADTNRQREAAAATASSTIHAGENQIHETAERTAESVRVITRVIHDSPAPTDCVLPAGSLRELQGAVDRANAAAGHIVR